MKVVTYIHKGKVQTFTIDELRKMKEELAQQWEGLCNNCGKCCFDKMINPNGVLVINYDKPCKHLRYTVDKHSSCDIYRQRFDECDCNTVPEALQKRYLPADCPYVKSVVVYKGPVDNGNWFKRAREKMTKINSEQYSGGDRPTGGSRNMPAKLPPRKTAMEAQGLVRGKKPDWKRRNEDRAKAKAGGPVGILDPREKTDYSIKPSGHAGGG
jgi:uncharacterized cysteine cluster protein YcgN (CxxCxxCC family)